MDTEQIKQAYELGYRAGMEKSSSALSDILSGWSPVNMIPYLNSAVALPATIAGVASPATEDDEAEMDKHNLRPWFIPGLASYRTSRRWSADAKGHRLSQVLGPLTSTLAASGLGAGLGAGIGALTNLSGKHPGRAGAGAGIGALSGAAIGGVTAPLVAAIAALAKKRRSDKEHEDYLKGSTLSEYLVPGVAAYNNLKTTGHIIGKSKKRREAEHEKSKQSARIEALKREIEELALQKQRRELEK